MNDRESRLFAVNTAAHSPKGTVVGVIAKRTYTVRDGHCVVADEQVAIVEGPEVDPETDALVHDMDHALNRTAVDVVVRGTARAPGQTRSDVRVRVAGLDRVLRVFGDRRCYHDFAGQLRFTEPAPIDEVDVGWTLAYGGVDMAALAAHGDPLEPFFASQKISCRPRFGSYVYPRSWKRQGIRSNPRMELSTRVVGRRFSQPWGDPRSTVLAWRWKECSLRPVLARAGGVPTRIVSEVAFPSNESGLSHGSPCNHMRSLDGSERQLAHGHGLRRSLFG